MSAMRLSPVDRPAGNRVVQPEPSAEPCAHFRNGLRFVQILQAPLGIRQDLMLAGV